MNLEMNETKIGAIFIMTQLNCQSWLFFNIFILIFLSISTIFIVNSSFIGISSWRRGPRVAIWVGTCIGNQAKVKSVKGEGWRGRGQEAQGGRGWSVSARALVVLFILLIAVLHGDALHASFPHRGCGLLHSESVAHRVVHLAVEGGVEDALQAKVPVLFLQSGDKRCSKWPFRAFTNDMKRFILPLHTEPFILSPDNIRYLHS